MLLTLNSRRESTAVNFDMTFYRLWCIYRWIYPFLLLPLCVHPIDPFPRRDEIH
jgi:hypothetical protein